MLLFLLLLPSVKLTFSYRPHMFDACFFVCRILIECFVDQQSQTPPASATLKKWIGLALNLTDFGLEALKDVSYLNGRDSKHPDRKNLDFKRVTLKLLCRQEFHNMSKWEQGVYIYRLAR